MDVDIPPFFRLARRVAIQSDYHVQMGAVLVDKKPIVTGYNKLKTHPVHSNPELHMKVSIHAEVDCLIAMKDRSSRGTDIYVYREHRGTKLPAMARPCKECMKKLIKAGVKRIFYSIDQFPYWAVETIK
jgi:deoxycytidylate deaminase